MNTREKLIELTNNVLRCLPWGEVSSHTAEDITDHLIANGVTVQEWFSSKERKPTKEDADKYGRVLVMELGMISLVNYRGPINSPERFQHWMPLPKPPKGE